MANQIYDNFFLSNEVEDQLNSHLDLQQFATVDRSLVGEPGMLRKINVYRATDGTEKLGMGEGNTKSIEVALTSKEYRIQLAQNRFQYYDEEAMTDPMVVPVGMRHAADDMFNTMNADIYAEFGKTTQAVSASALNFDAFVDAAAMMKVENLEGLGLFGFVSPADMGSLRKTLKDDLKYVEAFVRQGYIGTVAGINLYTKKDATTGTVIVGTRDAVTLFVKTGTVVEQITPGQRSEEAANIRQNTIFTRKYYLAALTDETKAVKITVGG